MQNLLHEISTLLNRALDRIEALEAAQPPAVADEYCTYPGCGKAQDNHQAQSHPFRVLTPPTSSASETSGRYWCQRCKRWTTFHEAGRVDLWCLECRVTGLIPGPNLPPPMVRSDRGDYLPPQEKHEALRVKYWRELERESASPETTGDSSKSRPSLAGLVAHCPHCGESFNVSLAQDLTPQPMTSAPRTEE